MSEKNEHAEALRLITMRLDEVEIVFAAAAEIERLAARVRELEAKVIADKALDDMSRRCLPPDAYEAMMLRRDWLLVKHDPVSDFVVEVIPEGKWRSG